MTDRERAKEAIYNELEDALGPVSMNTIEAAMRVAGLDDKFFQDAAVGRWVRDLMQDQDDVIRHNFDTLADLVQVEEMSLDDAIKQLEEG